jgi:hypothetical protein
MGVSTVNNKVSSSYPQTGSQSTHLPSGKIIGAGTLALITAPFYSPQPPQSTSNQHNTGTSDINSLIPWLKDPQKLLIDAGLSAFVYLLTYIFIQRHFVSFAPMKGFIQDIHNRLPEYERETFLKVREGLHTYSKANSDNFWENYFTKYILDPQNLSKMSRTKQLQAKACKLLLKRHRRATFALLVGVTSLIRAYSVVPDLNAFLGFFIGAFPLASNYLFAKADLTQQRFGKNSPEALRKSWIAEVYNFWGKVFSSSIKKAGNFPEMIYVASLTTAQRMIRDSVEGGIPDNPATLKNPVNRLFSGLPGMKQLRKLGGPLESGLLHDFQIKEHSANIPHYLTWEIGKKVAIKYSTQIAVVGFIGAGLSGFIKLFGNLFSNKNSQQAGKSTTQRASASTIPATWLGNVNGLTLAS